MAAGNKFWQLIVILLFGSAISLIGYHELSTKYLKKFKEQQASSDQLNKVRAIFGTDVDVHQASFDPESPKKSKEVVEQRKVSPVSELRNLYNLIKPSQNEKNN